MPRLRTDGYSLSFDGKTTRVNATAISGLGTAGTILAWFNPLAGGGQIINNATGTNDRMAMSLSAAGDKLRGVYFDGSSQSPKESSSSIVLGAWNMGAYSYDGATGKLYVNGVPDAVGATAASTASQANFQVGARGATTSVFTGNIKFAAAWNRVLSDAEILAIYQNYLRSIPMNGLMILQLYNEGSGTSAVDSSGNGNTGTITAATYSTNVPMQARVIAPQARTIVGSPPRQKVHDFGSALSFNGSTSKVNATAIPNMGTAGSVSFWYKASIGGGQLINNSTGSNDRFCVSLSTAGSLRGGYFNGSGVGNKEYNRTRLGVWTFGGYVWNGTVGRLYVAGLPVSTGTTAPSTASANNFQIGIRSSSSPFQGEIDEVRVWDTALTDAEFLALYQENIVPQLSHLKGEYLFNEGSGSTALDTSGNGNNGTITAGTYVTDVVMVPRTLVT